MLGNISILTEEQLDDSIDLVVEELEDHFDEVDDIDEIAITYACEMVGVNPTPQVMSAVASRLDRSE